MMTVLVTGATGTIGTEVTAALLARGAAVRALVRGRDRAGRLPPGVEPVLGDLHDPHSVTAALANVETALYVSPHDPAEVAIATAFIRTCDRLGVRIVFAGVHADGPNAAARWLARTLVGLALPHYRGKLRIGHLMLRARTRPVVFGLTNYYQNDELIREQILAGRYALPTHHRGVNRIDLRDAAEVIARVMMDPSFPSGGYPLAGPGNVSGAQAADTWSRVLGRPFSYAGADVDVAQMLGGRLSGQKLADFRRSYRLVARLSVPTSPRDVATTTRLLGRPPRPYEQYVRDTVARWHRESAPD
jgi:uncharacterized protein YbjT (DUF2867 family)